MDLGDQEAAKREDEPDRRGAAPRQAERTAVEVPEAAGEREMEHPQAGEPGAWAEQEHRHETERVERAGLAVGEDRVAAEDVRVPEREMAGLELLGDVAHQRMVEEECVTLIEDPVAADGVAEEGEHDQPERGESGGVAGEFRVLSAEC